MPTRTYRSEEELKIHNCVKSLYRLVETLVVTVFKRCLAKDRRLLRAFEWMTANRWNRQLWLFSLQSHLTPGSWRSCSPPVFCLTSACHRSNCAVISRICYPLCLLPAVLPHLLVSLCLFSGSKISFKLWSYGHKISQKSSKGTDSILLMLLQAGSVAFSLTLSFQFSPTKIFVYLEGV